MSRSQHKSRKSRVQPPTDSDSQKSLGEAQAAEEAVVNSPEPVTAQVITTRRFERRPPKITQRSQHQSDIEKDTQIKAPQTQKMLTPPRPEMVAQNINAGGGDLQANANTQENQPDKRANLPRNAHRRSEQAPNSWPTHKPYQQKYFRSERKLPQGDESKDSMSNAKEKIYTWYREFRPTRSEIQQRPKLKARRRPPPPPN